MCVHAIRFSYHLYLYLAKYRAGQTCQRYPAGISRLFNRLTYSVFRDDFIYCNDDDIKIYAMVHRARMPVLLLPPRREEFPVLALACGLSRNFEIACCYLPCYLIRGGRSCSDLSAAGSRHVGPGSFLFAIADLPVPAALSSSSARTWLFAVFAETACPLRLHAIVIIFSVFTQAGAARFLFFPTGFIAFFFSRLVFLPDFGWLHVFTVLPFTCLPPRHGEGHDVVSPLPGALVSPGPACLIEAMIVLPLKIRLDFCSAYNDNIISPAPATHGAYGSTNIFATNAEGSDQMETGGYVLVLRPWHRPATRPPRLVRPVPGLPARSQILRAVAVVFPVCLSQRAQPGR